MRWRFTRTADDAHVAAQEAFHIACEKIDAFMKPENQIGWLKNMVRNVFHRMLRDRLHQKLLFLFLDELTRRIKTAEIR